MIKVELHTHTADDPSDAIPHTTADLIQRASELGFHALAITLHDRQLDLTSYRAFARDRAVVLIAGIERTIEGKHVLLLNFPAKATETIRSLDEIAALKRAHPGGLVIAPHPFYPNSTCLRGLMDRHAHLFDAVEQSYFYTPEIDFNEAARAWARRHAKPMVGNSDLHRLYQLGRTYSLVDAERSPDAICEAVREGRVEVRSEPISLVQAARLFAELTVAQVGKTWRDRWPATEPAAA
ncbi:MAG: PHP-associated domain-containing protein [Bacteroidales bacterium]